VRSPSPTIGVVANPEDLAVAEEFFELFKTRWEHAVPGRRYGVVLSTNGCIRNLDADLFLVYSSQEQETDRRAQVALEQTVGPVEIEWNEWTLPVYGRLAHLNAGTSACGLRSGGKAVDYVYGDEGRRVRRIGYDLFSEVRYLLTDGQPSSRAMTPTLELHIALLRQLLRESGASFIEIPPCPDGYDFICCLTHDVDFFGIRRHKFDRTLAGFVARASIGTLRDLLRGQRPLKEAVRNWIAVASLPVRFLGLARDFWHPFEDYREAENGRRSTFFLVPFKHRPGVGPDGRVDPRRGVPYQICEIRDELKKVTVHGGELALHGIDAWRDSDAGRAEIRELTSITARETSGVRMHWLYFAPESPCRLEEAGFEYDSTCGYNDSIGYRAGTSQVFGLPGTNGLMELPLSIMDSAMFYPSRMGLAHDDARERCRELVANARTFGGTLVVNWHCRSLAPERLWGRFYQELLDDIEEGSKVWFATAGEAVQWFRWRRSIKFVDGDGRVGLSITAPPQGPGLPGARMRVHGPYGAVEASAHEMLADRRDVAGLRV
jgi:hypothetical protein